MMSFSDLVARHLGLSLRKQLALMDFLGEHSWQLSLDRGVVDFGKAGPLSRPRVYPVQILGTQSDDSGTWRWAWANAKSNIPAPLLRSANKVRALGQSHGVSELVEPDLPGAQFPGHLLAHVGAGICAADAYYRGPYQGGAVFFLLFETPLKAAPPTPVLRVSNVLIEAISQFEILNQRLMVTSYLQAEGFLLTESTDTIVANAGHGRTLTVSFDSTGRICDVGAQVA